MDVFFPGGDVDLVTSAYAKAAKILFDLVMQANECGDYFPVWGECLGMHELAYFVAGENLLTLTCTQDVALPLNFTKESKQSKLFRNFPKGVLDTLASESMTGNMHNWSLSLKVRLHSLSSIIASAKSAHRFYSQEEEERHLIYGHSPVYPAQLDLFQQAYFFDREITGRSREDCALEPTEL
ncbi:unnamed protein product [Lampetra planeri]